jgi:hypothetical protein
MTMNRRLLILAISISLALRTMFGRVQAADSPEFDPIATAKLRIGEIVRKIAEARRDTSRAEPSYDELFGIGLLLQAGLRALLPVHERQGVALPGTPSPGDRRELVLAQENYKAVFESGMEANPGQRATAVASIEQAAQQLRSAGYTGLADKVTEWLKTYR